MEKPGRHVAFGIGVATGSAIWLLSPLVTGHAEPWDAPGAYYPVALFLAGLAAGLLVPFHWIIAALGIFAGQALVLVGCIAMGPASGGLWPLGLAFLIFDTALALVGAGIGAQVAKRGRPDGRG